MDAWVEEWRHRIRPLREEHGFKVLSALVVEDSGEFLWLLAYDGPGSWEEADAAYHASPGRAALDPDPARHITEIHQDFVRVVG